MELFARDRLVEIEEHAGDRRPRFPRSGGRISGRRGAELVEQGWRLKKAELATAMTRAAKLPSIRRWSAKSQES